jgi:hypothetical protein
MQARKRCVHYHLRQIHTHGRFALGPVRSETYRAQKGAENAYLHVLPKDLPAIRRTADDAVLDQINSHVFCPCLHAQDAGKSGILIKAATSELSEISTMG